MHSFSLNLQKDFKMEGNMQKNYLQGLLDDLKAKDSYIPSFLLPAEMGGLLPPAPMQQSPVQQAPVQQAPVQRPTTLLPEESERTPVYDLPPADRQVWALLESSNNPKAKNKGSGAIGLYQFLPKTAKELGLQKGEDLYNPRVQNRLLNRYTNKNAQSFLKQGLKEITPFDLYMAHQQGFVGYNEISRFKDRPISQMKNKNRKKAILSNIRPETEQKKNPTIGDFLQDWRNHYMELRGKYS
tara:strand:+ start:12769 stop:13491 length:723 start_codon:yes stop_codon:yes gene_type:complete